MLGSWDPPAPLTFAFVLGAAAVLLLRFLLVGYAYERLGVSRAGAIGLLISSVLGSALNLPLGTIATGPVSRDGASVLDHLAAGVVPAQGMTVALNVGVAPLFCGFGVSCHSPADTARSLLPCRAMRPLLLLLPIVLAACRKPSVGHDGADAAPPASSSPAASTPAAPSSSAATSAAPSSSLPATAASADAGGPCPAEMAKLQRSCIDRWEASLMSVDDAGQWAPHPHYERPVAGVTYMARSESGVFPQAYISRVEAAAACKVAGKRLCGIHEWKLGCMGKRYRTYPYGNQGKQGVCNSGKPHLLSKMFGTNGRSWKYDEHFNSPALNQEPGFLAKTGEYSGCVNDNAVFDTVGNLHEWVSDSVSAAFVEKMNAEEVERKDQPWREGNGIFMGGFFSTTAEHGPGCRFTTIAHEPTYHDYSTGFRCCKSL